jgi:putative membrane protein|tara:strand:+ start:357 stop:575 length:219 start_codon:yes stop_codon:yes gene_type:complete
MDFEHLGQALLTTFAFSMVGIIMFALAFFLMGKLTPFSLRKEIEEDENDALAMIMSAIVIGIALIIMGALLG